MSFSEHRNSDPISENDQEDKVNIEEACVNLGYVKKELNEKELAFEDNQYKIALTIDNVFGQSFTEQEKRNRDSLIGFLDGDVIMKIETGTIKLEDLKQQNKDLIRKTIEQSDCNKCGGNYQGYCLNCSSLSHILNNLTPNLNTEPVLNTTPLNMLEIREVSRGCAVFALKTLPKGIILGPFDGIAPIESTTGLQWKLKDRKLVNAQNGNWMKYIDSVPNHSSRNLEVFQMYGILYFETSREIQEGEELLVCYREEKELLKSDKEEVFYLVPVKKEGYPKVFACTHCCLGFRLESCLVEHKCKCPHEGNMEDCNKCGGNYQGYCLNCSSLSHILNNLTPNLNTEPVLNTTPLNMLEIREVSRGCAVFALKTLPKGIILGPFDGIAPIESTTGLQWKLKDRKLVNAQNGNWMKYIDSVPNHSSRNLEVFQMYGILYFETSREIQEGEELLVCYREEKELLKSDKEEVFYLVPVKKEGYPKVFACTHCCLGFRLESCLVEHKCKCPHEGNMEDFEIIQCRCCKVWLEKEEHLASHMVHCRENYNRLWSEYSKAVDRSDADIEEMEVDCDTKDDKRRYRRDICSRPMDRRNDLQLRCSSGANHETLLNECTLAERSNNEQTQNAIESNNKSHLQTHLNKYRDSKFQCDICMAKFRQKGHLNVHIKNKHTEDKSGKDYKCSECPYETNSKSHFQRHLAKHTTIKPFKCDICMMQFTLKDSLKTHTKHKHRDDGSSKDYQCLECSYQTNYKYALQRHLNKHKGIKPFQCDICLMKFAERAQLKLHTRNEHTDDGKNYKCSECSYETNYKHSFQSHLDKHRGIKPFKCATCMAEFTKKCNLKTHIRNKHTNDESGKDYKCSECSYQTNYRSAVQMHFANKHSGIKPFKCDICMQKFALRAQLKAHTRNTHADDATDKDYKCSECSYQTNYRSAVQMHLANKHTGIKPFKCDICMQKFALRAQLKSHTRNEHTDDGKNYKCSECPYETNYKQSFQSHLDKHRGIKPFECATCMAEFTKKSTLKTHIRNKHTSDESGKDYKCSECSYETNYKHSFQSHLDKHRGIKPFKCATCMAEFTQKSTLKTHIRNKHTSDESGKDYKCSECSYQANYRSAVQRHLANKHTGIKPFKCDICMQKFALRAQLKAHTRNTHVDDATKVIARII